jgi:hypothetical protein
LVNFVEPYPFLGLKPAPPCKQASSNTSSSFFFFFGVVLLYVISMLWKLLIFNFSNCLLTHEPNLPWPKLQP